MNKKKIEKTLPLSDYLVLDLTIARAGPTAVRLLSDWGADVIRIEAPVEGDIAGSRQGPDSQNLHRNKRSLCLNLKTLRRKENILCSYILTLKHAQNPALYSLKAADSE